MDLTEGFVSEFGVLEFSTAELQSLEKEELKFLLTCSLISNDIRFHWSLMIRSRRDGKSDELVEMQMIRELWVLRKLASVIWEADIALNGFLKKHIFARRALDGQAAILPSGGRDKEFMALAGKIRNRITNHYGVGELALQLQGFALDAKHRYYAHSQQGNSLSGFCEQIITVPLVFDASRPDQSDEFRAWCRSSSNEMMRFCNRGIGSLVKERFPAKVFNKKEIEVHQEAAPLDHRWPLFSAIVPSSSVATP
ncbi:MAG: hypothetical protein ACKVP7_16960 [Hyphomicrobiaceae bacterium]